METESFAIEYDKKRYTPGLDQYAENNTAEKKCNLTLVRTNKYHRSITTKQTTQKQLSAKKSA